MPDLRVIQGGGPAYEAAGELADRVKDLVYEYADRLALATAIGALEIAKLELLKEHTDG